ncbi:DUF317 domain-containing protein [Streptomyces sp. GZWMJZ-114]|uniref:DUF317 domain-containing protein n=1 Tax=Streptomyces sp. GZWMJZ-114 TaxID=2494734 RepID=UPI0010118DBD|nr:DUF317 domain-containing protein [Streptomyces sp. GZWMJZ-114]
MRLVNPDGRTRLEYHPADPGTQWRLYGEGKSRWLASFSEVPAEILARLTDALVLPAPATTPSLLDVLGSRGWHIGTGFARSPDNRCLIDRPSYLAGWRIDVLRHPLLDRPGAPVWTGTIPDAAPPHLAAAFVTALADPAPLLRGMYDRTHLPESRRQRSPVTSEQFVTAHTDRLRALRAAARSSPPESAPKESTTAQHRHFGRH